MNNELIRSILESIDLELLDIDKDIIKFKDLENNKEYSYKSVYSSGHFYTENDKRLLRCLQNGCILTYLSVSVSLKNIKEHFNNGSDIFGIRYSSGLDSNHICVRFNTEECEQSLFFGQSKDGKNFIRLTRFYNPDGCNTIGDSISLEEDDDNKYLSIYDFNKYVKTSMHVKNNKFTVNLVGNQTEVNIVPIDITLNDQCSIEQLIGTLIVNRREIVDELLGRFKKVAPSLYDLCKEMYPFFKDFSEILDKYEKDEEIDEMVEKYSSFVEEAKKLNKKLNNINNN